MFTTVIEPVNLVLLAFNLLDEKRKRNSGRPNETIWILDGKFVDTHGFSERYIEGASYGF